ncbi:MAG: class I SAM-dependent methyltransferase [Planctomycetes bacterium]|nr:class I SAM-dependent methyltransferase [Planctomycetota bacterium]
MSPEPAAPPLPNGVPTMDACDRLLASPLFTGMEQFSDAFLARHEFLRGSNNWVRDPLHQWSRQWEYPFVASALKAHLGPNPRILDTGSGITFFPYHLAGLLPGARISCVDLDPTLPALFDRVKATEPTAAQVSFHPSNIASLPFPAGEFDALYCISVLEHTGRYEDVLAEFVRVLRPGGIALITFDVALDDVSEIDPDEAELLLAAMESQFAVLGNRAPLSSRIDSPDVLTAARAVERNPALLPWRWPFLSLVKAAFRSRRWPTVWRKNLTVYCAALKRP